MTFFLLQNTKEAKHSEDPMVLFPNNNRRDNLRLKKWFETPFYFSYLK